jgi:hypothetical protein
MTDENKTDVTSRVCSILAIVFAILSLGLHWWQSCIMLRPKIAIHSTNVYKKDVLPTGDLDFGIQFNFENRGQSEARDTEMRIAVVVDNKQLEILESGVSNDLFPNDVFNRALSMLVQRSLFDPAGVSSITFKKNLYFKVVITYSKQWFGRHKQVFYIFWNRETNRFEHCSAKEASAIDEAANI